MKRLYILIALAVALAVANASVFVYYQLNLTLTASQPAVYFVAGNNAGQPDVMYGAGNTIDVTIDSAGAQAWITVHPTYQKTYYKDVLRIVNQDSQAYTVWLIIDDAINVGVNLTSAKLYVKDVNGNPVNTVDLSQTTSTPIQIGQISGRATWRIDLEFQITGYGAKGSPSQAPKLSDTSASLRLVYSPSSETPP
ncbi:hypothetical protein Igag_1322 [Ignisphaera aggregans DSM 17230]|uniref:Uncharacterized protein n=1 Tax=Ignisphaera aggregans (strain DSM 17230 / JCM 13409 / AQ1.S1) TaxID=583356 RepID=E0SPS0_IGNAA|nr:hypothetical protein Igag_1322 [Ignisphaera aggregans DSM 17230]